MPKSKEGWDELRMKRVEANDPVAIFSEGTEKYNRGDYQSAFEYWSMAAELGDVEARFRLSVMYCDVRERGVENEKEKYIHHAEKAAIAGHPHARVLLGFNEMLNHGNVERAVKHYIIAATHGYDTSIKYLIDTFKTGFMSKEELTSTLRAYQIAVDATKSRQRKEAEDFFRGRIGLLGHYAAKYS